MPKFKGRAKRWAKKLRNQSWKAYKKELLGRGWVEVAENTLVPEISADAYPPFLPTHLGGKIEPGSLINMKPRKDTPRRSEMNWIKKYVKRRWTNKGNKITVRQFLAGRDW